jgi:hypothetical protein
MLFLRLTIETETVKRSVFAPVVFACCFFKVSVSDATKVLARVCHEEMSHQPAHAVKHMLFPHSHPSLYPLHHDGPSICLPGRTHDSLGSYCRGHYFTCSKTTDVVKFKHRMLTPYRSSAFVRQFCLIAAY